MTDDELWQRAKDQLKQMKVERAVELELTSAIRASCANCLEELQGMAWMLIPMDDAPDPEAPLYCRRCMRPDPQRTRPQP